MNKIKIELKTFYGLRRTYSLEIGINEQICDLIKKLIEAEEKFFSAITEDKLNEICIDNFEQYRQGI